MQWNVPNASIYESDVKDTPNDPKENEIEEVEDIMPELDLEYLMVIKETTSTTVKKWLRDNSFHSKGTVNG